MGDMNIVAVVGRLTDNATSRTSNDWTFYSFRIANNQRKKQGDKYVDDPQYFDVSYGTKSASMGQYLVKGKQVAIEGTLKQERWERDGQKYSRVVISANEINFIGQAEKKPEAKTESKTYNQPTLNANGPETFDDGYNDIPF